MSDEKENGFNRRDFIAAVGVASTGVLLAGCGKTYPTTTFLDAAPDGAPLKAGVVGCGGRGSGAAQDFLKAGPNVKIAALADVFEDRLAECRKKLADKNQQIPDDRCFVGFDAFKRLIDTDVDIVILATPPHFRPQHFEAAVDAKKHIFMEKPVAVDPVGIRSILAYAVKAKSYNLCVGTGTQRRHQREYIETYNRVANGAVGRITAARAYWNQSQLWFKPPKSNPADMADMIRDWVNWTWLSGDHIVEQHVHNLDVIHWFTGDFPVKAVGMGARMRRVTGDQYDFFAVDYTFKSGLHMESMCRQIDGCIGNVSETVVGTDGYAEMKNGENTIYDKDGKVVWQFLEPSTEQGKEPSKKSKMSPYVQEHIDLVTAIRNNKPYCEAENTARSTLAAIMGRISAYTGQEVTLDQVMDSKMRLGPAEYVMGPVDIKADVAVPGTPKNV